MGLDKFQFLHRLTGFSAVLFILFFAVTGIILNHTGLLDLDDKSVASGWLLSLYSIEPRQAPVSYAAADHWLTQIDARLYFDQQELSGHTGELVGAVHAGGITIAALADALLLLTDDGEVIEKITRVDGLPDGLRKIGSLDEDLFIIDTAEGRRVNNAEIGEWRAAGAANGDWSVSAQLPASELEQLLAQYRGQGLSLERVLLDLHSGRLLGRWKWLIVDSVALLIIFSAISGIAMWYKKKKLLAGLK